MSRRGTVRLYFNALRHFCDFFGAGLNFIYVKNVNLLANELWLGRVDGLFSEALLLNGGDWN
jgi:hypothetical protein